MTATTEATAAGDLARDAIRAAIADPTFGGGLFAEIWLVRAHLDNAGIKGSAQDALLIRMYREQELNLVPESNGAALTGYAREQAVWCGGEDKHLVALRPRGRATPPPPIPAGRTHPMTASASLRPGQVVRYDGSVAACRGELFRVSFRYACTCKELGFPSCELCERGYPALYDLSAYDPAEPFRDGAEVILGSVRPKSVTHVPAAQARKEMLA
jgi:hypothetical protein